MPELMNAVVLEQFGEPEVLSNVTEVRVPRPADNEILVEVRACGVCYLDSIVRAGVRPGIELPLILGHEIAGTVAETGAAVVGFRAGDRVASTYRAVCGHCYYCRAENSALCINVEAAGVDRDGGYAQYVVLPESSLSKVPDGVSDEEATIAGCVLGAVYKGVVDKGRVRAGDNVLVTGSGGGAGIHSVQLAANSGARVIAATTSPGKVDAIKAAGADDVVVGSEDEVVERVKELTEGRGAEVVLDTVGKATSRTSFRCLARGGRLVFIGELGVEPVKVSVPRMLYRETEIYGVASPTAGELTTILTLIEQGKIKPAIGTTLPLAEAATAHEMLRTHSNIGRTVLRV
jgi:2-desacetyl-2-hydroxyethyl bacteriochlorophyllide A dehydrogenase